jgi:hypothetical protein
MQKNINKNRLISIKPGRLFLYIFLSWSLAVAQPLMNVFSQEPAFLTAHDLNSWPLFLITISLNFLMPILLTISLLLIGLISKALKEWLAIVIISFLIMLFALPFFAFLQKYYSIISSVLIAGVIITSIFKFQTFRLFLVWYSFACLIFIAKFLFFSPVKNLLKKQTEVISDIVVNKENPIFLIVFDEFPLISILNNDKQIDAIKFPAFADFSKQATWYPNTTTVAGLTTLAIPSILSGLNPITSQTTIANSNNFPINLFTLFAKTHKLNVHENFSKMCPQHLCKKLWEQSYSSLVKDSWIIFLHTIYPQHLRKSLPAINNRLSGFSQEQKRKLGGKINFSKRLIKFNNFLDSFKDFPSPSLHFIHSMLPHSPWRILPDLTMYGFYENEGALGEIPIRKNYPNIWHDDKWLTELSWRRHLLQVGAVDSLIANTVQKIKELGVYDKSTIIITSDHGLSFYPNFSRRYAHDKTIVDIAFIPLFIKYPGQKQSKIDNRIASNVDILPTLMDVMQVEGEFQVEGISLISDNLRLKPDPIAQEGNILTEIPENYDELIKEHTRDKNFMFANPNWSGVYKFPEIEPIYGLDTNELRIRYKVPKAIKLTNASLYKSANNNDGYTPVYYRLNYLNSESPIKKIFVAVDNKIVSHCYVFAYGENECAGLFEPSVFNKTNNTPFELRYYSFISLEEGKYLVDELLDIDFIEAEIISALAGESLFLNSSKTIAINNSDHVHGFANIRESDNGTSFIIDGWAADTLSGDVADSVYIFINNKLFTVSYTGKQQVNLVKEFGFKSLANAGFQARLPLVALSNFEQDVIRVFANYNNTKFLELNYYKSKTPKLSNVFKFTNNL